MTNQPKRVPKTVGILPLGTAMPKWTPTFYGLNGSSSDDVLMHLTRAANSIANVLTHLTLTAPHGRDGAGETQRDGYMDILEETLKLQERIHHELFAASAAADRSV